MRSFPDAFRCSGLQHPPWLESKTSFCYLFSKLLQVLKAPTRCVDSTALPALWCTTARRSSPGSASGRPPSWPKDASTLRTTRSCTRSHWPAPQRFQLVSMQRLQMGPLQRPRLLPPPATRAFLQTLASLQTGASLLCCLRFWRLG